MTKRFIVEFEGEEDFIPMSCQHPHYIGPVLLLKMLNYEPLVEYIGPPERVTPCQNRSASGVLSCRFCCPGRIDHMCVWSSGMIVMKSPNIRDVFKFRPDHGKLIEMIKTEFLHAANPMQLIRDGIVRLAVDPPECDLVVRILRTINDEKHRLPIEYVRDIRDISAEMRGVGIKPTISVGGLVSETENNLTFLDKDQLETLARIVDAAAMGISPR